MGKVGFQTFSDRSARKFVPFSLILLLITLWVVDLHATPQCQAPPRHQPQPRNAIAGQNLVPLDDFLEKFLVMHGLTELKDDAGGIPKLLEKRYITVRLGLFDLWYPRYLLAQKDQEKQLREIAGALLDMQTEWLTWTADEKIRKAGASASKVLKKWVQKWKLKKQAVGKKNRDSRPDLLDLLKARGSIREASERFSDLLAAHPTPRKGEEGEILCILSPTREDFLGLGSFIGSRNPTNRQVLWKDGLAMWTSFNRGDLHVIALSHPSSYPGAGDVTRGLDMNAREKTGLLQHVVQHAMDLLLARDYADALPADLVSGLSMNMVTALFGENNVRAGGGSGGTWTAAFSKFVAGGASSGGRLAARNADCRWRLNKGKDRFLKVLREAQKAGAKKAAEQRGSRRDKRAFFALEPDSGVGGLHLIEAPVFTGVRDIPSNYRNDSLEFLRAYRAAFVHWLMEEAESSKDRKHPSELLRALLNGVGEPAGFEESVNTIYGKAYAEGESSLEWEFLTWLSKKC